MSKRSSTSTDDGVASSTTTSRATTTHTRAASSRSATSTGRNSTRPAARTALVRSLERSAAQGTRGLKVWKDLGLSVQAAGRTVLGDDPRLAPIWDAAGTLGLPVLVHTADPLRVLPTRGPLQRAHRGAAPASERLAGERRTRRVPAPARCVRGHGRRASHDDLRRRARRRFRRRPELGRRAAALPRTSRSTSRHASPSSDGSPAPRPR